MTNRGIRYVIEGSDSTDEVKIMVSGMVESVPVAAIVGRARGLEVLRRSTDFARLLTAYPWRAL